MKKHFKLLLPAIAFAGATQAQHLNAVVSTGPTIRDAIITKTGTTGLGPGLTLDRLGHLESGTYWGNFDTWSHLGRPSIVTANIAPLDQSLYGLLVHDGGDRALFGTRNLATDRSDGIIAWGDNDTSASGIGPDRFVFEFHESLGGGAYNIKRAMTMMPNGPNGVYVGIGTYGPTEQLHTTAGVRFQGVTTGGSPTNLVGIDANGKLWRTSLAGVALGNLCGGTLNNLTGNYEIPMNGFNFNFTTPLNSASEVLIGYPTCISGPARLNVTDDNRGVGIRGFSQTNGPTNIGVHGLGYDPGTAFGGIAAIGVLGETKQYVQTNISVGVGGFCGPSSMAAIPVNQDIAVYGNAITNNGRWAGYFDGDVTINAGLGPYALTVNGSSWQSAGTLWATSDRKFKKDIMPLEGVSEKLKGLSSYSYYFRTDEFKDRHFDKGQQIGFIAQELQQVFPQLVSTDPNGDLAVNYQGMIPVLWQLAKEQQAQLDEQKKLIDQVLQRSGGATGLNSIGSVENGFQMSQNEPNPFTHETVVKYTLPQTISNAFMAVYDLTGKQITTFPIYEKGSSSITITSEKLAAGIYIYSIVADGKVIDSKRMIVAEK